MAANSDHLIQWAALRQVVKSEPAAISERERCDLMVRVINGERLTGREFNLLAGVDVHRFGHDLSTDVGEIDLSALRQMVRDWMTASGAERTSLQAQMAKDVEPNILLMPVLAPSNQPQPVRVIAYSLRAAFVYSLWILLSTRGEDLRRCKLSTCGNYFFRTQRIGPPLRTWCSAEHTAEGLLESARNRMAAARSKPAPTTAKSRKRKAA